MNGPLSLSILPWIGTVCLLCASPWRAGLYVAALAQIAYLCSRGIQLGRLPLLGPHDTLLFFSCSLIVMGGIFSYATAFKENRTIVISTALGSGIISLSAMFFRPLDMPLPQILDTVWFELHVIVAFLGYALFVVSGIAAAAFLISRMRSYLDALYMSALVGWTFFSLSMISGGIWGYYAWGTYWLWTPKELWTSILWLFYAMLLHMRLKGARYDAATSWMAIIGVFIMLFTYLGVSLLMKSSHSF